MKKLDLDKRGEVLKGLSDLFNVTGFDNDLNIPDYVLAVVAYNAVLSFGEVMEELNKHFTGIEEWKNDETVLPVPKRIPQMPKVKPIKGMGSTDRKG